MAVLMEEHGILAVAEVPESRQPVFIPSACWRNIAPGILSTTRFTGMVLAGKEKLAVYDIGDGEHGVAGAGGGITVLYKIRQL